MDGLLQLVQRGGAWAGCGPTQSPSHCTGCNSPSINGQYANFILLDVAYDFLCTRAKELTQSEFTVVKYGMSSLLNVNKL